MSAPTKTPRPARRECATCGQWYAEDLGALAIEVCAGSVPVLLGGAEDPAHLWRDLPADPGWPEQEGPARAIEGPFWGPRRDEVLS